MISHSIFNDVLGPIMAGPSSSHSAGCARIGRITRLLWGKDIKKAVVIYDAKGSYPSTCVGQGSNFGFTGGLLGFSNDDPRMKDSQKIAKEMGVEITFEQEVLSQRHPNEARIDVYDEDGCVGMSVLTFSTGGGMFEIVELDGFPIFTDGSKEQIYVCCYPWAARKIYDKMEKYAKKITVPAPKGAVLSFCNTMICAEEFIGDKEELVRELENEKGIVSIRKGDVVLPVPMRPENQPVFSTAEEALHYQEKEMWQLAVDYECSLGEVTPEEVWKQAEHTLDIMKAATTPPDPDTTERFGFLPYQAVNMQKNLKTVKTVHTGYLEKAMMYALALQNMLGLICDPIGGLTEIPCISRNVSAMANAVQSANMVMLGFDPVVPFDETIKSMYEVGQSLPAELRCTCKGGLCTTKTAECIVKKLENSR